MHRMTPIARVALAAIAFTALPAHAQSAAPTSNVVVYGLVDAVVRHASNANAARASLTTMEDGIITGTRLGFRGSEDLGGGLRAVFTMESGFDPSSGVSLQATAAADYGQSLAPTRFWGREINVGVRNQVAGLTFGRQYTTAHQIAARFQPLGNPNNTALSVFSSHHVARQDNVVRLDATFGDVGLQASRTLGEQAASQSPNASWALGATYAKGALQLGGYFQKMNNLAGTETRKIAGFGGNYKIAPVATVFAGYMQRSSVVSPQKNRVWALGANVEVAAPVTISLEYFDDRQSGSAALNGARKVAWVQASYRFSRRSDVYAAVDQNRVTGGYTRPAFMGTLGTQTALNLGLRHRF